MKHNILKLAVAATLVLPLCAESIQADLFDQALASARQIEFIHLKANRLADVGRKLALSGRSEQAVLVFQEARRLVPQIQTVPRGEVDARIASEMAAGGLFGEAQAHARTIPSTFWRGAARAEIVQAMLNAGKVSEAEVLASGIESADFRAQALSDVALARSGSKSQNASIEARMANYRALHALTK